MGVPVGTMTEGQRLERDRPLCAAIMAARDAVREMVWPVSAFDSMLVAHDRAERVAEWADQAEDAALALLAAARLARRATR